MPRSRSTRVLWLLEELGKPYELTIMNPPDRKAPEHLERHPLGRVPVLELDDGTMMFESAAILLQLADLDPDAGLIPPIGSSERALTYQWVQFGMTELEPPLYRLIRGRREGADQTGDHERFAQAATALEAALGDKTWLIGDCFTVADIVCAGMLGSAHSRELLEPWPRLSAYVERAQARPAHESATTTGRAA
jgi:glutathione S-transferase